MTEDKHKDINNTSEKDEPEGTEPEKSVENPDEPEETILEVDTAGRAAETQNPLIKQALQNPPTKEKPPEEIQTVEDFDLNLLLDIPLEITVELGRAKVQIQAYFSAIVQNLKRLLFPLYCWLLGDRRSILARFSGQSFAVC